MAIKAPVIRSQQTGENGTSQAESPRRTQGGVKGPAFIRATGERNRRLIVNIEGEEKSGKDHMALTYNEGPIYLHSFDIGTEGVVDKFAPGGEFWYEGRPDIMIAEYELEMQPGEGSAKEVGSAAGRVWDGFVSNYKDSVLSAKANQGLVIVDTGTEMWELLRLASFGKLTQVMPHHYGPVNAEMRELVRFAYEGHCAALLHKSVDEWENYVGSDGKEKGRKTGRKGRKGFSDMPFLVQCNVQCWREDLETGGSNFWATVIDCRQNPDLNNTTIGNDFNELLAMALK